jgi:hypothetical protein
VSTTHFGPYTGHHLVVCTVYIKEKVNQAEASPLPVPSTTVIIKIIIPKRGIILKEC